MEINLKVARIRTIKPEFFKHSGLYDLEKQSRLPLRTAFAGLWTVCDRDGRFAWRPRELKTDVLPHDEVDFAFVLEWLRRGGFVASYVVDGERYGFVPSWKKHQVINHRERPSTIPAPGPLEEQLDLPELENLIPKNVTEQNQRDRRVDVFGSGRLGGSGREGEVEREREVELEGGDASTRQNQPPETAIPAVSLDTPRDLTQLEYARRLLSDLGMPEKGNIIVVADSIKAYSTARQTSLPAAFEQMRAIALDARDRGDPLNHFWFQDARYLNPRRKSKTEVATDEFHERFDRERQIIARANIASA